MVTEYSVEIIHELEKIFLAQQVFRPLRILRFEPGTILEYEVRGIVPSWTGRAKFKIERFVGGGYAGQVYKSVLLGFEPDETAAKGLEIGNNYALKILVPPTRFARWFRNFIYALGFQGPFSLQSNPDAARASAFWQKFIRRGAKIKLSSESSVVDVQAAFIDHTLGSCGEVSEWVEGRTWRFEVDDNLDARLKWKVGDIREDLGSPEYRKKREFMSCLVELMHEMGAVELARQYEWWTLKSQPNSLQRLASDPDRKEGLVAVDFRAGLALLPFIPMCPADFRLIIKGISRGSFVQFDRGYLNKLELFVHEHEQDFVDMRDALGELKQAEKKYRDSLPDISHHHFKLLTSQKLRSSIMKSQKESWRIRNIIDEKIHKEFQKSGLLAFIFYFLGIIPIIGKFLRKFWGRADYRRHLFSLLTSLDYFKRASRARIAESLIRWHRSGRLSSERAIKIAHSPWRFFAHFPLSLLPPSLHHFLTDWSYARQRLDFIFVRPVRLYFNAKAREEWLLEMVSQGEQNGMLSREEAVRIKSQVKEPFIQKYLKSLAVHLATLFVSETVFLTIAIIYVLIHPELSWPEASLHAAIILGAFQFLPVSPGSLIRGFYVTFLILRERNFRDYSLALPISFLKLFGYLAFPTQMAYRYPDLARFMAGHWATGAVHIVPVFGEKGAWLEHFVFDAFYNYPLTIRRRLRQRAESRVGLKSRFWHLPLTILAGTCLLALVDLFYLRFFGNLPSLKNIWWVAIWVPLFSAAAVAKWAGGAPLPKRILWGMTSGAMIGLFYALFNTWFAGYYAAGTLNFSALMSIQFWGKFALKALWQMFLFAIIAIIGGLIAEIRVLKK